MSACNDNVPGACAPWRRLSVVVFPCVGVCGYPVRTECGHACGGQHLQNIVSSFSFFLVIPPIRSVGRVHDLPSGGRRVESLSGDDLVAGNIQRAARSAVDL